MAPLPVASFPNAVQIRANGTRPLPHERENWGAAVTLLTIVSMFSGFNRMAARVQPFHRFAHCHWRHVDLAANSKLGLAFKRDLMFVKLGLMALL